MTTLELIERQTDVLALRREQIDRIHVEKSIQTVLMADALKHNNVARAQEHRRRWECALEVLGTCLGT